MWIWHCPTSTSICMAELPDLRPRPPQVLAMTAGKAIFQVQLLPRRQPPQEDKDQVRRAILVNLTSRSPSRPPRFLRAITRHCQGRENETLLLFHRDPSCYH